jgi:hypothetical protein
MIEIEGPLKFEQKEANETIRKIAGIVNDAIRALREVATNGRHMQDLEKSLQFTTGLLCFDVTTKALNLDVPRRLKKELCAGRARLVEMNDEEEEADINLFDPEEYMFISTPEEK